MSDPYQLGSDIDWLRHTNDELGRALRKRNGQLGRLRLYCFLLLLAAGWVVYKYSQVRPLETLWDFKAMGPNSALQNQGGATCSGGLGLG